MSHSICLVIRTVNRIDFLKQLIASIENQSDKRFSVLAINNGGGAATQHTLEVWHKTSTLDVNVRRNETNLPNVIFPEALHFDYLIFVGDDDLLLPTAISTLRSTMGRESNRSMYAFSSKTISKIGWRLPSTFTPCGPNESRHIIMGRLLMDSCFIFSATAFQTACLQKSPIDFAQLDYCVDWLMALLCLAQGEPHVSRKPILKSRLHAHQDSTVSDSVIADRQKRAMLINFAASDLFGEFANSLSDNDFSELLAEMRRYLQTQRVIRDRDVEVLTAVQLHRVSEVRQFKTPYAGLESLVSYLPKALGAPIDGERSSQAADIFVPEIQFPRDIGSHIVQCTQMVAQGAKRSMGHLIKRLAGI